MFTIEPKNKAIVWVLSPHREDAPEGTVRKWAESTAADCEARYVSVNGNRYAFSDKAGFDFASVLSRTHKNLLYIESVEAGTYFLRIDAHQVAEDRLIKDAAELTKYLKSLSGYCENQYQVVVYGLTMEPLLNESLQRLSENEMVRSGESLLETTEVVDDKDAFVEISDVSTKLTDRKTQNITMAILVAIVAVAIAFWSGLFDWKQHNERVELLDDYERYSQDTLNRPALSSRLVQDFHIHRLLRDELPYWKLYKVTHTQEAIEYRLISLSHLGTLSQLNLIAKQYGFAVLNDRNGVGLVAGIHAEPIYDRAQHVRRFPLNQLTNNIIDNTKDNSPFLSLSVNEQMNQGVWASNELTVFFNNASSHDLMRLAAVVDGSPVKYPTFFSTCQGQGCTYEVNAKGLIKGTLNFEIYGDAISKGSENG